MNIGLKYLIKNDINDELDKLVIEELFEYKKSIGKKCDVCGIIQGKSHNGWKRYFCEHIEKEIHKEMKEEKEKMIKKIFFFTSACQGDV